MCRRKAWIVLGLLALAGRSDLLEHDGDHLALHDGQLPPLRLPAKTLRHLDLRGGGACGQRWDVLRDIKEEVRELLRTRVTGGCLAGHCEANPASSCTHVYSSSPSLQPPAMGGHYWIRNSSGAAVSVYCDFQPHCAGKACNATAERGWVRAAYFNATDPAQRCPAGLTLRTEPRRLCGKTTSGCSSALFPSRGLPFSRVCGRVLGYQQGEPDAFKPFYLNRDRSIEDVYVDGVSITHGWSPRRHIWTFAAAQDEGTRAGYRVCPCTQAGGTYTGAVPGFIGRDYFCETGSRTAVLNKSHVYLDDPLWDGRGCGRSSACCEWNRPPVFCRELASSTTDSLELRLCSDSSSRNEGTPLELVELYVQ